MKSRRVFLAVGALVASVAGCSSPAFPGRSRPPLPYEPAPTVLITNPACNASGCDTLSIGWHPWYFLNFIPMNPLGAGLGLLTGSTGCFQFPGLDSLRVGTQDSTETPKDLHVYYWRPDNPEGVALVVFPYDRPSIAAPVFAQTQTFVPADALGWDLTFGDQPGGSELGLREYTSASLRVCGYGPIDSGDVPRMGPELRGHL